MQYSTQHRIRLGGRVTDYMVHSTAARKLRVRVGPNGVEVVPASTRNGEEAATGNSVRLLNGQIVVARGRGLRTAAARSLERAGFGATPDNSKPT